MLNQEVVTKKAERLLNSLFSSARKRDKVHKDLDENSRNGDSFSVRSESVQTCRCNTMYLLQLSKRFKFDDFHSVKALGVGAFGLVRLVREKETGKEFALKQISKVEAKANQAYDSIMREREILAKACKTKWIVKLHCCFQDEKFLFFAMEYLPGGDLMTHLIERNTFTEQETAFVIAEIVEAVDYLHVHLRYAHRDLKPDNILFRADGHIKLVDFGLSTEIPREPNRMYSILGTPDYMAPELYTKTGYGPSVDFWSIGIILFEMVAGGPPFADADHNPQVTVQRVQNWQSFLRIPRRVSQSCDTLIRGLITDSTRRLTASQIRLHSFMAGIDFKNISTCTPPFIPAAGSGFEELPPLESFEKFQVEEVYGDLFTDKYYDFEYVEPPAKPEPCKCRRRKSQSDAGWDDYRDDSLRQMSITLKSESPEPISIIADTSRSSINSRFPWSYRPVALPLIFGKPAKPTMDFLPKLTSLDFRLSAQLPPVLKLAPPLFFRN